MGRIVLIILNADINYKKTWKKILKLIVSLPHRKASNSWMVDE